MKFRGDLVHAHGDLLRIDALQLERRRDVVEHGHRRVVDELLINHREIALAHTDARHVLPVDEHAPAFGLSSPAITRISVVLPAWVGPSSTLMAPGVKRRSTPYRCVCPPETTVTRSSSKTKMRSLSMPAVFSSMTVRASPAAVRRHMALIGGARSWAVRAGGRRKSVAGRAAKPARERRGRPLCGTRPGNCQAFGSSMSRSFLLDTDAAVVALIFKKETKTTRSMFLFVRLR